MPAFYSDTIKNFQTESPLRILGYLSSNTPHHQLIRTQRDAWIYQIRFLKETLENLEKGFLLFEYPIPRRGKRIDNIIIFDNLIFVIEIKIGSYKYFNADIEQIEDYCLDLRDFHKESHKKKVIPVLISTDAPSIKNKNMGFYSNIHETLLCNQATFKNTLNVFISKYANKNEVIDTEAWNLSDYTPTPTIIEAAKSLYAGQNVREISRSHADDINLTHTTDAIIEAIETAKSKNEKLICFITGVPGAGKTLAGLNIVHNKSLLKNDQKSLGVFLSGNGPLVKVLNEALARDHKIRMSSTLKESRRHVSTFIQNVHHFLEEYHGFPEKIPIDKVVLFDEAQRAWDAKQSKLKFKRNFSESFMMLDIMNRHKDWAVIVALIGGGQEINNGEAGLKEWGNTISYHFSNWNILISEELASGNHSTGNLQLFGEIPKRIKIKTNRNLHLQVSIRAYKAEKLSEWVDNVLDGKSKKAQELLISQLNNYPIFITRNFLTAKEFLQKEQRGLRRAGFIASSGARRLRPLGIDVTIELDVEKWFLNSKQDIRSSCFLELAATEFAVQGLELDWAGICWGADFRRNGSEWEYFAFKGTRWQNERKTERHTFIKNKYRVLLTRAREGFIIWVPPGSETDTTRPAKFYDGVYNYLISCGVKEL